jgi:hypothetical protein
MRAWERIRRVREDLTDFVVHLTKKREEPRATALQVLLEILRCGYIRPTFCPMMSENRRIPENTIKGQFPAVCLTEMTLAGMIAVLGQPGVRYAGYGIAFHKTAVYSHFGRPVIYGDENILQSLREWQKHLWVRYDPEIPHHRTGPVDHTWEREWRIRVRDGKQGLPIVLDYPRYEVPEGAIIVDKDRDILDVRKCLRELPDNCFESKDRLTKVISLEKARKKLALGEREFARIDTWPEK